MLVKDNFALILVLQLLYYFELFNFYFQNPRSLQLDRPFILFFIVCFNIINIINTRVLSPKRDFNKKIDR